MNTEKLLSIIETHSHSVSEWVDKYRKIQALLVNKNGTGGIIFGRDFRVTMESVLKMIDIEDRQNPCVKDILREVRKELID